MESNQAPRSIIGEFVREYDSSDDVQWFGEHAEKFDATDYVLNMHLKDLHRLEDNESSTDEIGLVFIDWQGSFSVNIVESIKAFFKVNDLKEITEEMKQAAAIEVGVKPSYKKKVMISIPVTVMVYDDKQFNESKPEISIRFPGAVITDQNQEITPLNAE